MPAFAAVARTPATSNQVTAGNATREITKRLAHRTFHRTMTREAEPETILGDFEHNNTLIYQGIRAEMMGKASVLDKADGCGRKKTATRDRAHGRLTPYPAVSDKERRYVGSPADCLRYCPGPLDASQRIVFLPRWEPLPKAHRRMECELCLLPQCEGPASSRLD